MPPHSPHRIWTTEKSLWVGRLIILNSRTTPAHIVLVMTDCSRCHIWSKPHVLGVWILMPVYHLERCLPLSGYWAIKWLTGTNTFLCQMWYCMPCLLWSQKWVKMFQVLLWELAWQIHVEHDLPSQGQCVKGCSPAVMYDHLATSQTYNLYRNIQNWHCFVWTIGWHCKDWSWF